MKTAELGVTDSSSSSSTVLVNGLRYATSVTGKSEASSTEVVLVSEAGNAEKEGRSFA